jgi:hypothetical protein
MTEASAWADVLVSTLRTLDLDIDAHDPYRYRATLVLGPLWFLLMIRRWPALCDLVRGDVSSLSSNRLTQERRLRFPSFRVLWYGYSGALTASLACRNMH